MRLFSRIFGSRRALPPDALLQRAIAQIAGTTVAEQALAFFRDPEDFLVWLESRGQYPAYAQDEREPTPAELASEIFSQLLSDHGHIAVIDWKTGVDGIVDACDRMFALQDAPPLEAEEIARMHATAAAGSAPDAPYMGLRDRLHAAAGARGLALAHMDMGQDAHFPLALRAEHWPQIRDARFGKHFPVIP
jgi:hypothetical protein